MLDYNGFKNVLLKNLKNYLPNEYKECEIRVEFVPKINGFQEAIIIMPSEKEYVVPNIYIKQFYEIYCNCENIEETIDEILDFYVKGLEYGKNFREGMKQARKLENIVLALVNRESNEELLDNCPYREYLDLAVIYRLIMELPDGSFNSAILTCNILDEFGVDEEQLFNIALENTKRMFPPLTERIGDFFHILTNKRFVNGAASMLFEEELKKITDKLNRDIYIIPSSIHEVIAIPVGERTVEDLRELVREGNETAVEAREILSGNIYIYRRDEGVVRIAG